MPAIRDASGRLGHVRTGVYNNNNNNNNNKNNTWRPFDPRNGNVTYEAPTNDISEPSEAADWLEIYSKDPQFLGRPWLSDILGNGPGPHEWNNTAGSTPAAGPRSQAEWGCFEDPMDLDGTPLDLRSEGISDGYSAASPPALTTGTSVDACGEFDEDVHMTDSPPQSPHPQNVWPKLSDTQLPLKQTIELSSTSASDTTSSVSSPSQSSVQSGTDSGTSTSASSVSTPQRESSSPPGTTRGRILRAPEETNEVRKIGACYRCRISRVKCDTHPVCERCSVAPTKPGSEFVRKTCIREEPSKVGGTAASRWSWKIPRFYPRRDDFKQHGGVKLHIRFPHEKGFGPYLEITASPFTDPSRNPGSSQLYGIIPMGGPKDEDIHKWAARQIVSDNGNDFETLMEKLLQSYVEKDALEQAIKLEEKIGRKPSLSTTSSRIVNTQKDLLKNILCMRRMWKVWSCERFDVRIASDESPLPLGWDISAIEDHLHSAAEQALSSLEKTILRDMDRYLSPSETEKDRPALKSAMNIAVWVILWQMILLYRQSVIRTLNQQELDQKEATAAPFVLGMRPANSKRYKFHETTDKLYKGVVVMYSELFRTRKVLEGLEGAAVMAFGGDASLHNEFQDAWEARKAFYGQIERNKQSPNPLLESLVIIKERAGFKRGRGHNKHGPA